MSGRLIGIILIGFGLIAGVGMYYLQVYAFYDEVALAEDGGTVEMRLTGVDGADAPLDVAEFRGIDASSSPIRFRACFTMDPALAETAQPYADAVPLVGPGWFDCFDATEVGTALESGEARAVMGQFNVIYGIDRILAVYPDGRAFAWHQINRCGEEVFDGNPPPEGCPPAPERG